MSIATIAPSALHELIKKGTSLDFIDVRTPVEYQSVHAPGTRLVPLDALDTQAILASRAGAADEPIYLICKAGARGKKACEKFCAAGFTNVVNVEGGTDAWIAASLPVQRGQSSVISLERQVRIAAGAMVLVGVLLGFFVHRYFLGLSAFVGAGLMFAGITDSCCMGMMLAKMPWNQAKSCGPTCSS